MAGLFLRNLFVAFPLKLWPFSGRSWVNSSCSVKFFFTLEPEHVGKITVQIGVGRRVPNCGLDGGAGVGELAIGFERIGEPKARGSPAGAQPQRFAQGLAFARTISAQATDFRALDMHTGEQWEALYRLVAKRFGLVESIDRSELPHHGCPRLPQVRPRGERLA